MGHPYRPAPPEAVPATSSTWRRRLLATLPGSGAWYWVRAARGGHWTGFCYDPHEGPWSWEVGGHPGRTCAGFWCEDHGDEVPPLRVSRIAWAVLSLVCVVVVGGLCAGVTGACAALIAWWTAAFAVARKFDLTD